jgi:hypothetical protein
MIVINNRFEEEKILENLKENIYNYIQQWLSKKGIKNTKSVKCIDSNIALIGVKANSYSIEVLIGARGKKDKLEENKKVLEKLVKDLEEKLNSLLSDNEDLDGRIEYGLEKDIGRDIFG